MSVTGNIVGASPPRLQHAYPQWEPPEDDPTAPPEEFRQVWRGTMRIVHRQRASKLRRRGVPMWTLHKAGERAKYAWFVEVSL